MNAPKPEARDDTTSQREVGMYKRIQSFAIVVLVASLGLEPRAFAELGPRSQAVHASKVRAALSELGTGAETLVVIRLADRTELRGYMSQVDDDGFVVTDPETGIGVSIAYEAMKQLDGRNLVSGKKIATQGKLRRAFHAAVRVAVSGLPGQKPLGPSRNNLTGRGVTLIVLVGLVVVVAIILVNDK